MKLDSLLLVYPGSISFKKIEEIVNSLKPDLIWLAPRSFYYYRISFLVSLLSFLALNNSSTGGIKEMKMIAKITSSKFF